MNAMNRNLRIDRVGDRLDEFIGVPFGLHADDPTWIPPLYLERRDALKPGGTPFLRRAQTEMWIARRNGRAVGRISAQIDPFTLKRYPGTGHFGLLAAEDDPAVFDALLSTAEGWLRERGMQRVLGPFSLSINEESGLLVDGFDTPPMMMMPHDRPYIGGYLERAGYAKAMDLLAYCLDTANPMPDSLQRLMARPLPANVTLRTLNWSDYAQEIQRLVGIFNDAWSENWGSIPFDQAEIDMMAKQLRPLIERRFVWFAEVDGEAVAFVVCLPNLNEAIEDLNGRLLPFGWAKLLWRIKVSGLSSARVPLMGVRKRMNKTLLGGILPFLLIGNLHREVHARGIAKVELSWVLENNKPMRAVAEALSGPAYKTYRVYEKPLA